MFNVASLFYISTIVNAGNITFAQPLIMDYINW